MLIKLLSTTKIFFLKGLVFDFYYFFFFNRETQLLQNKKFPSENVNLISFVVSERELQQFDLLFWKQGISAGSIWVMFF